MAYRRVYQEKELLKWDYLELEALNSLVLSIGEHRDLSRFLFKLCGLLCEKLGLERCTAIFMDSKEDNCRMVSSDDFPGEASNAINVKDFPSLKESLKSEEISEDREFVLPFQGVSRYILKKIPIFFKEKKLGTLYLRANTLKHSLTHREQYFLRALGQITAMAIVDAQRSTAFEQNLSARLAVVSS